MMKKSEQELADELDVLLTELLAERPLSAPSQHPQANIAAELVETAVQTEPDPQFKARLEARLARAAKANQQKKPLPKPSFWQQLISFVKEDVTMKRTVFALGGLAAFVLIAFFAWTQLNPGSSTPEPIAAVGTSTVTSGQSGETTTDVTPSAGDPTVAPDEETIVTEGLAQLPSLAGTGAGGFGGGAGGPGMGGGGGLEAAPVATDQTGIAVDMPFRMIDIFSNTTFILNTTLPIEPRAANVLQQTQFVNSMERAQQIATALGFTGSLYTQYIPNSVDPAAPQQPSIYFAFDGTRNLNVYDSGFSYYDTAVQMMEQNVMPYEQAAPIAEAYLRDRGLLNFPYRVQKGYVNEVFFYRLVDDKPTNYPEILIGVDTAGQIGYINYNVLENVQTIGRYPLLSAEEAWQIVQSGILTNNLPYNIWPNQANILPIATEPAVAAYQNWLRTYQPGEEIHLYGWPNTYVSAQDANAAPRVEMYASSLFVVQGSNEDLLGIIEAANQNSQAVHVWGQVGADGQSLQLAGWEALGGEYYFYTEGTIQITADNQVTVVTSSGETYILPNAPADITNGLPVYVSGGGKRDVGLAYPIVDWTSIDKIVQPEEIGIDPIIGIPEPYLPYIYQQIEFTSVELVYYLTYIYPEYSETEPVVTYTPPPAVLQPAWKFTGTAENGDTFEVFVQAVSPEFIQPTATP